MTESASRLAWSIDVVALGACFALVSTGSSTIHAGFATAMALIGFVMVLACAALAVVAAAPAQRMSPMLLAVFVTGMLTSHDPKLAVIGFALSSLLPVAAIHAARARARLVAAGVAALSVLLAMARLTLRDPFRELRSQRL